MPAQGGNCLTNGEGQGRLGKLATNLEQHSPFSDLSKETTLRNIITGINADKDVNVQYLFVVGRDTVNQMKGQSVFSYSYKRTNKGKMLASARTIKVTDDISIDYWWHCSRDISV